MISADFLAEESLEGMDLQEGTDALQELEELADAFGEFEGFAGDGFEADGFEGEGFEELFAGDADAFEEDDGFEGFERDLASGLYLPSASPRLISGPAAVMLARTLNPFVLESMDADDSEAFFRRISRGIQGAVRGIARGARQVARRAAPLLRRAAPLLRRALPVIQRVAGLAGPWGRVLSAGIGAAQGLMEGRGVRGALAGAVGGLIPGAGGRLASSLLRGDGADDDASLDALADMTDALQVPPAVALPLGAGLAARVVSRQAVPLGTARGAAAQRVLHARTQRLERYLMQVARRVPGSVGRRLRVLRAIAWLAARNLSRREPGEALGALPRVVRGASRRVLTRVARAPGFGVVAPRVAAQRVRARQQLLRRIPVSAVSTARLRPARA